MNIHGLRMATVSAGILREGRAPTMATTGDVSLTRKATGSAYRRVMARTRDEWLGPAGWPVAIPDDIDDPRLRKASGVVTLPLRIHGSDAALSYNVDCLSDCCRVYEQVLRAGTEDDVRRYIDVTVLQEVFDDLVLPPHVRRAWAGWFRQHRGAEFAC
jgi:hypothetical protein